MCLDVFIIFFFNDAAPTEIYTLSLHDALPISLAYRKFSKVRAAERTKSHRVAQQSFELYEFLAARLKTPRSEEHTSELQSHHDLVCRLLLEKKKNKKKKHINPYTQNKP